MKKCVILCFSFFSIETSQIDSGEENGILTPDISSGDVNFSYDPIFTESYAESAYEFSSFRMNLFNFILYHFYFSTIYIS